MAGGGTVLAVAIIILLAIGLGVLGYFFWKEREENDDLEKQLADLNPSDITPFVSPLVQGCYMSEGATMDRYYVDGVGQACKFTEPIGATGTVFEMVCPGKTSYEVPQIYIIGSTGTVSTSIPPCTVVNTNSDQVLRFKGETLCGTGPTADIGATGDFYYLSGLMSDVILNDFDMLGPTGDNANWMYTGPSKSLKLVNDNTGYLYNTGMPNMENMVLRGLTGGTNPTRTDALRPFGLTGGATDEQIMALGPFNPGLTGPSMGPTGIASSQWSYVPVDVTQNKYRVCLSTQNTFCLHTGVTGCANSTKPVSIKKYLMGNTGSVNDIGFNFIPEFNDNITRSTV